MKGLLMAGRTPGVTGHQLTRLKVRAWMYEKQGFSTREVGRLLRKGKSTIERWLAEVHGLANDDSLHDLQRQTLVEYSLLTWTWAARADMLLERLEEAISIPYSTAENEEIQTKEDESRENAIKCAQEQFDLAVSYARRWEQKWEAATMIGWRNMSAAAAARSEGGQAAQFHYNSEEFYREIREYRRRVPLLAGQQQGLLESPEDRQRRVAEFIKEYGTEKLPSETL